MKIQTSPYVDRRHVDSRVCERNVTWLQRDRKEHKPCACTGSHCCAVQPMLCRVLLTAWLRWLYFSFKGIVYLKNPVKVQNQDPQHSCYIHAPSQNEIFTLLLHKGAFKNYVDHFWPFFDHLPTSGWQVYLIGLISEVDIWGTTYLPPFVNVV